MNTGDSETWDCLGRAWSSVRATLWQCHYYNQRYSGEGKLIGSEHTGALTQWLSSVYIKYRRQDFTWHSGYPQRSIWGAPTASDELYSCSGWHPQVEFKLILESGMGIRPRDRLNDVSSDRLIRLQLRRYDLMWSEPWQKDSLHSPNYFWLLSYELYETVSHLILYHQGLLRTTPWQCHSSTRRYSWEASW